MAAGFAVVVAICQLPPAPERGLRPAPECRTRPTGSPRGARFRFLSTRVPAAATGRRAPRAPFFRPPGGPAGGPFAPSPLFGRILVVPPPGRFAGFVPSPTRRALH